MVPQRGPIPVTGKFTMNAGDTDSGGNDVFKWDREGITTRLLKNCALSCTDREMNRKVVHGGMYRA